MLDSSLFELRPDNVRIVRRKKPATLVMSIAVHGLIAGSLILIPLLQTQAVPPDALPPPVQSTGSPVRFVKLAGNPASGRPAGHAVSPASSSDAIIAPSAIPDQIAYIADVIDVGTMDSRFAGPSGGPGGGQGAGTGVPGLSMGYGPPTVAAPPQPPPAAPMPPPVPKIPIREPIRVASSLQKSLLVHQVDPLYPSLARRARIEGSVVVEAQISKSGTIDNLRIISGNPLLLQSVIDAVKQWRYEPTLLNGEPIDVITTVTVNFTLN